VAAYGFDEGSGTVVNDASGNENNGTISGATWTTSGKYGNALIFNGTSALVTINNAPSLQLTSGMTLEAWVYPTTVSNVWRDVIYKGNDNYYVEGTSTNSSLPAMRCTLGSPLYGTVPLTVNTWAHLAATYDGATMRLYVNGTQVASRAQTGAIATSTYPLQIGGDSIYGQYFAGLIDEVRIYNQALSVAEIQSDMNTPVTPPSTPTPTPTATATPCLAIVPDFVGVQIMDAQIIWQSAGFSTEVITDGPPGHRISWQSLPPGYQGDCSTTVIVVSDSSPL